MSVRPNIVLVHGAFADGSCWSGVIERLQADGYRVTAPQFPLTALADDVARLRQVRDGRPAVENAAVLVPGRRKLAAFWAAALGRPVDPDATPESAAIAPGDSGATGPRLSFHQVPEPKSVKNRLHLDLISNTFEAESQPLVTFGASGSATSPRAPPAGRRSPTPKATSSTSSPAEKGLRPALDPSERQR